MKRAGGSTKAIINRTRSGITNDKQSLANDFKHRLTVNSLPRNPKSSRSSAYSNSSPINDGTKSKKKGNILEDIKEEIDYHFKQLDDPVKDKLIKICEDPKATNIIKGMAKFYIGLDRLISNNFLKLPTIKDLDNLQEVMEEKLKKVVTGVCYDDYTELKLKGGEKFQDYELDFAKVGCLPKFLCDIEDELVISNQDNFDKSRLNNMMMKNSFTDIKSYKSFSDNQTSPNNYAL